MTDELLVKIKNIELENENNSALINEFIFATQDKSFSRILISLERIKTLYNEFSGKQIPGSYVLLNENDYINNEYVQNVKPLPKISKNYKLSYKSFYPYQPLLINDVKFNNYQECIDIGYFSSINNYKYLSIEKKNHIWMEITPHEINTMQKSIDEAYGNVLVYGLGLGYYAYMVAIKDNVNKVTIIEKDINIINLFVENLLEFFPDNKIEIVYGDALKYIPSSDINYCFADLWHDATDGLDLYLKLIKNEKEHIKYSYWLEDSLLQIIRRYFICILTNLKIRKDKHYNLFNSLLSDKNIKNDEDIERLLSYKEIKKIIKR